MPRCRVAVKASHSVALLGNKMYINTGRDAPNPRLIALDKNSGEVVFDVSTATSTASPVRDIPQRRSRSRTRSWSGRPVGTRVVGAMSPRTRRTPASFSGGFSVVPEPGQPGSETWADPRTIPFGGGGVWTEPSYDPDTNLAYFGTGNPVNMFDPQGRPGDNLYTSSHHCARCRYRPVEMVLPDDRQRRLGL